MIGHLTSVDNGPERNVLIDITKESVFSEISVPSGAVPSEAIDHYEISGLESKMIRFYLVLRDSSRVLFYQTRSKFDFALLADQMDSVIGARPRKVASDGA